MDFELSLEPPPPSDGPISSLGGLFSDGTVALAQATAKLTALDSFIHILTRETSFNDFACDLLLGFLRVVKSEAGTIFEIDHASQTLFFRAAAGRVSDLVRDFRLPVGQGIAGHVAESRQPLVVSDAAENRIHLKQIGKAVGFETRNLIAVPIIIRGRVYGVVELLNRVGEASYTESDLELLRYLCDVSSKVVEARLMIAWGAQAIAERSASEKGEAA